jgi:hypothetical protein
MVPQSRDGISEQALHIGEAFARYLRASCPAEAI